MNKLILSLGLCFGVGLTAPAAVFMNSFTDDLPDNGAIPDGNPNPWSDTRTISGISGPITAVTVRLNISGGYNGDLYGYLSYNNTLVPLVNRLGVSSVDSVGYDNAGFNVSFSDSAERNIHFYQTFQGYSLSGGASWKPDGRTTDPSNDPAPTVSLSAFSGMSANGNWTLVMADVSGGGGDASPTVVSWGVDITAVPEPSQWTALTALTLAAVALRRRMISTQSRQEAESATK